jgi:drug/metabolite transporter (DMT)-like permease
MILLSIVLGPLGNTMLGKGMRSIAPVKIAGIANVSSIGFSIITSPFIWLGIACLLGFMVVHMLLLTWADYSYVQPATSLAYATVALLSYFLLGEIISPLRWLGIAVICLGVFIVGRTAPSIVRTEA